MSAEEVKPPLILVTGSRKWINYKAMKEAWWRLFQILPRIVGPERFQLPPVLIHGDCQGADRLAVTYWTKELRGAPEPVAFPADFTLGPGGGPRRNQEMVDQGPDVCLAFPIAPSKGTMDCIGRASVNGIPVFIADDNGALTEFARTPLYLPRSGTEQQAGHVPADIPAE